MDENLKKKIVIVKGLIQKKQYKEALDDLEVLMYKYQKTYQVHLMSGLCYEKLDKLQEAQKCYKQVVELKQDEPNAIKALCEIYTKRNDLKNATVYLQKNVEILKKADEAKYRQAVVKLVEIYRKDEVLEKIYNIFTQYCQKQTQIGEDFVQIADAYFHVSINCKSFNLQKFQLMGMKGEQNRPLTMAARQKLNNLLIEIVDYLKAVSKQFNLSQRDIANSLYQLKYHFPQAPSLLMLMLIDQYCVAHVQFSTIILQQIYKLLCAYYNKEQGNSYLNLQYTEPQIFTLSMVLSYQYLAFFQQFFTLDPSLQEFIEKLASQQQTLLHGYKLRQDYNKKINNFILKNCRYLSKASETQNLQQQIESMKKRIQLLDNSFLEQVIAKIGMNCFINYQKLNDMKNMLKTRIKNLQQGDMVPHLYKYYLDYLMKIAKIYKILDEQINVYDVIEYINKYDQNDVKYLIEGYWLSFSKAMLLQNHQQKIDKTKQQIANVLAVIQQTSGTLKADSLRRVSIMKVFIGDFDIESLLKQALLIDRSFSNLQTLGMFLFHSKKYSQALTYLKQAFILNQSHYHTNRLIFILLFKLNCHNEAIDFAERIKEGFRSVFWVNYVLALKYMNLKKYIQAEEYLNAAIEAFSAGCQQKYKFSYEKTQEHDNFAFLYMIQQNQITILFDELILPQSVIFQHLPITSSLHFKLATKGTQIKLFSQMGEVLKILGRTKSALNYLAQAFQISEQLTKEQRCLNGQSFEICVLQKQYATLLFYMQMFRECQIVIVSAYNLCKEQIKNQKDEQKLFLLENIESEIDSLSFEVAVKRLSIMSRFQSYETVDQYLRHFKIQKPKRPSANFYKGKYQFFVLKYLHKRQSIQNIQQSIVEFLSYFNLSLEVSSVEFENRFYELDNDKKQMIKQCLQDYFVIKYISSPENIKPEEIMPLIQLFPRSTVFYIIYGMSVSDVKMKTAAFLKCIQLDKQSPISMDLLASLYLKQKNYLAAAKLFLKSLEMNILSAKCYLGLSICLFCIIGNTISNKDPDVITTIHKALIRINSYMEYLRTVDPSQNYHLLKFLKLLINDETISNFQIRTVLQSSKRSTKYKYRGSLIFELLEQATKQWKQHNIWAHEGQIKIIGQFLERFKGQKSSGSQLGLLQIEENRIKIMTAILSNVDGQIKFLTNNGNGSKVSQFAVKQIQKLLNQLCIAANLALKTNNFDLQFFHSLMKQLQIIQSKYALMTQYSEQNIFLIKKLKSYLFEYLLLTNQYQQHKKTLISTFRDIETYDHFVNYPHKIPNLQKELFHCILLNPNNQELKRILSNFMVVNGKKISKGKYDYKVQLINNTHENLANKKQTLKKLCLLYRDKPSYIEYISMCWQQPNSRTKNNIKSYLSILEKIQTQINHNGSSVSGNNNDKLLQEKRNLLEKLKVLKLQIYSYYMANFESLGSNQDNKGSLSIKLQNEQQRKVSQSLIALVRFYKTGSAYQLKQFGSAMLKPFPQKQKDSEQQGNPHQFILLQLLSHVTNKYEYNSRIQQLLINTIDSNQNSAVKSFLLLLRFLYILHRPVTTEQQLLEQILHLETIISQCEQSAVSQNTITILKCAKCLISADYENLAVELSLAANNKILTYSDQLLINFFEIIRLYKEVESNPNKEGVIEQFAIYIQQMILLVKDPFYQGFFISLKAIVNSIIVPDEPLVHDRNLKLALLLSPHATKPFVKNQNS